MRKDKRVRSTWRFVWNRMKGYECCLWIVAVFLLLAFLLAHANQINLCYLQIVINSIIDFMRSHITFIDGWTYSVVSGIVVYFLTVVLPSARRGKVIMPMVVEKMRSIKGYYYDLSDRFCGENWCENESAIQEGVLQVKKYGKASENGHFYTFKYCDLLVKEYVKQFCKLIDEILEHKEELLPNEFQELLNIRYSDIFEKVLNEEYLRGCFNEKDVADILEKMRAENIKVNSLYDYMDKRVFTNATNNL